MDRMTSRSGAPNRRDTDVRSRTYDDACVLLDGASVTPLMLFKVSALCDRRV